jgi:hypothetical protein
MFIVQTATDKPIDWPVTVEYAATGGKIAKHTFTGYFKVLDDDQREALQADVTQPDADPEVSLAWKDSAVDHIMQVMTGWSGVVDQNRAPIEFTRENLRTVARSPSGVGVLRGINTAIAEIATGAKAKN